MAPRVAGLRLRGGPQLFAQLRDDIVIERADSGTYQFRGGHRLWAAPEVPSLTYASDNHTCHVTADENALAVTGPVDAAGLVKEIVVRKLAGSLAVDHTLTNAGDVPLAVAPWAITQLRQGGIAIIPVGAPLSNGLQADRSLVLWPYTDLSDRRLSWRDRAVVIDADPGPQLKLGTGPQPVRLGYLIDGHLFVQSLPAAGAGAYPDRGAVGQCYLNDAFCELESVGAIVDLQPGAIVAHRETWTVEECDDLEVAYRRILGGSLS